MGGPSAESCDDSLSSPSRCSHFVRALARHGLSGSMGRVGAAGDNAAMESFFALLQNNFLDRCSWSTRAEFRIAIVTWIQRITAADTKSPSAN